MRKISLTTRISLIVTVLTIFVLLATISTVYYNAHKSLKVQAEEETQFHLDLMVQRLSTVQTSVETAAINSIGTLHRRLNDTIAILNSLQNIVRNNPYVNSAAVAYAPDFFPGQPYCMPIASRYGSISGHFASKDTNGEYIYNEWYMVPATNRVPFWTDPYSNELNVPVVSYAVPIVSDNNHIEGVLTLSIELSSFVNLLADNQNDSINNQISEDVHIRSQHILLDRNTSFLTTPHTSYIMNETMFTMAESLNDTTYRHIGKQIVLRNDGLEILRMDGEQCVATWRILPKLQWTAMVVTPYSEVFASLSHLTIFSILVALLAVLISVLILVFSIRHQLQPLKRLKSATRMLGEGHYEATLPAEVLKRHDEIGELGREFIGMKNAIEGTIIELEENRENVKETNLMLTMLIQNVVTNMQGPLSDVLDSSEGLAVKTGDSEDAKVFKSKIDEGGKKVLQQFSQLKEMANLISLEDDDSGMLTIRSNEFMESLLKKIPQLEEKYFITVKKSYYCIRPIMIKTDPSRLEALIYQLAFEVSNVSNTSVVNLYSTMTPNEKIIRFVAEAETDDPVPAGDRDNFFTQFAKQRISAYGKSDTLQLYICHYMAKLLGGKLYIDPSYTAGNRFVLEYIAEK